MSAANTLICLLGEARLEPQREPLLDEESMSPALEMGRLRKVVDHFYDATVGLSFGGPGFRLRKEAFVDPEIDVDLTGRVVVVTGANAGLGYEVARGVVARGGRCAMVCRNAERAEEAKRHLEHAATGEGMAEVFLADLSLVEDTHRVANLLHERFPAIDALVNNAGVLLDDRVLTKEGLETSYATNVVAGVILTHRLRSSLAAAPSPRVVHVTSGGMYTARLSVDKMRTALPYDGVEQYARTKRAQVVLNEMWRPILATEKIFTAAMHPGWADTPGVQSSLPRFQSLLRPLLRTPEEGADTALWLAAKKSVDLDDSGKLWLDRSMRRTHYLDKTRETESERQRLWAAVLDDANLSPDDISH